MRNCAACPNGDIRVGCGSAAPARARHARGYARPRVHVRAVPAGAPRARQHAVHEVHAGPLLVGRGDGCTSCAQGDYVGHHSASSCTTCVDGWTKDQGQDLAHHPNMTLATKCTTPPGRLQGRAGPVGVAHEGSELVVHRVCKDHTVCTKGKQFEIVAPGNTNDRKCQNAIDCTDTEAETKNIEWNSDRDCKAHTSCLATEWEETAPGICQHVTTSKYCRDRKCTPISTCEALVPGPDVVDGPQCRDCPTGQYKEKGRAVRFVRRGQFQTLSGQTTCETCNYFATLARCTAGAPWRGRVPAVPCRSVQGARRHARLPQVPHQPFQDQPGQLGCKNRDQLYVAKGVTLCTNHAGPGDARQVRPQLPDRPEQAGCHRGSAGQCGLCRGQVQAGLGTGTASTEAGCTECAEGTSRTRPARPRATRARRAST